MREFISATLVLGPALVFGWYKGPGEMGLAIIAGALAAAFLNLSRFQSFKGGGFEAVLQKAVEEAYVTINNLRRTAQPLIVATIEILTTTGRWGGMSLRSKHNLMSELDGITNDLKVDSFQSIIAARAEFFRAHSWDFFDDFVRSIQDQEVKSRIQNLEKYRGSDLPSERRIKEAISGHHLNSDQEDRLQDYLFYKEKRVLRRPDVAEPE